MPELPEVEVVKRSLRKNITNLTIKKVKINIFKLRYSINKRKFSLLKNHKIKSIERRSKYLLFILNKDLIVLYYFENLQSV